MRNKRVIPMQYVYVPTFGIWLQARCAASFFTSGRPRSSCSKSDRRQDSQAVELKEPNSIDSDECSTLADDRHSTTSKRSRCARKTRLKKLYEQGHLPQRDVRHVGTQTDDSAEADVDTQLWTLQRKVEVARIRAVTWKSKYEELKSCVNSESDESFCEMDSDDSFEQWIAQDRKNPIYKFCKLVEQK